MIQFTLKEEPLYDQLRGDDAIRIFLNCRLQCSEEVITEIKIDGHFDIFAKFVTLRINFPNILLIELTRF